MKTLKFLLIGTMIVFSTSFKSDELPKPFSDLLERAQMTFDKPAGLVETELIENRQMNYEFAVKYPDKNFEVRYAIRPLDNLIKDYEEKVKNKGPHDIYIHPNTYYSALLRVTVLNIAGGKEYKATEFDKRAVKSEFNADWGAITLVEVGSEFGQKYKYCMVVAIHKDNAGDAYYFYLSDSKVDFNKLMQPAFHSLRFK